VSRFDPGWKALSLAGGSLRHLTVRDAFDLDRLRAAGYPIRLSPPDGDGITFESLAVRKGPLSVFDMRSGSGFRAAGGCESDAFSFSLTRSGTTVRTFDKREVRSRLGTISISRCSELTRLDTSPQFRTTGVLIESEFLARQARLLGSDECFGTLAFEPVVDRSDPAAATLARSLECLHERMMTEAGMTMLADPLMQELLCQQILHLWPRTPFCGPALPASAPMVRRARDYVEAHLAEPFTVSDVAIAAGTSVRALQSAFRRNVGLSPVAYILNQRLERAHAQLKQQADVRPVSQIAYQCGFLHMSDFARRYRERFGCTPSQTRQQRSS
jgi:AraC-like DNA-binding protein